MEYKIFNSETYIKYICSGEQRLCIAIIVQAIKDVHSRNTPKESVRGLQPRVIGNEAIQWILSDKCCPFSFLWCLEHAFPESYEYLDVTEFRKLALSKPLSRNSVNL